MKEKGIGSSSSKGAWKCSALQEEMFTSHNKLKKKVTLFCILILEIEAFCGRTVDAILSYTVDLLLASDPFVVCVCHY